MPNVILANNSKQIITMDIQWSDLDINRYQSAMRQVLSAGGFPADLSPEHYLSYAAYIQRVEEDKKLVEMGIEPAIPNGFDIVAYDVYIPVLPSIYTPAMLWDGSQIVIDMPTARALFVKEVKARVQAGYIRLQQEIAGATFAGDDDRVASLNKDLDVLKASVDTAQEKADACADVDALVNAWPRSLGA